MTAPSSGVRTPGDGSPPETPSSALLTLAKMECPIIILSKQIAKETPRLPQLSPTKVREASKRLREALSVPEALVCRTCSKSSRCSRYQQKPQQHPPQQRKAAASPETQEPRTEDVLLLLQGLHSLARIHLRALAQVCNTESSSPGGGEREKASGRNFRGGVQTGEHTSLPFWSSSLLPAVARERELEAALTLLRYFIRLRQQQEQLLLAAHGGGQLQQQNQRTEAPCLHLPAPSAAAAAEELASSACSSASGEALHMPLWIRKSVKLVKEGALSRKQRLQQKQERLSLEDTPPELAGQFKWMAEEDEGSEPSPQATENAQEQQKEGRRMLHRPAAHAPQPALDSCIELDEAIPLESPTAQRRFEWLPLDPQDIPEQQRPPPPLPRFDLSRHPTPSDPVSVIPKPRGGYSRLDVVELKDDKEGGAEASTVRQPEWIQALGGMALGSRVHPASLQLQRQRVEELLQRENLLQAVKAVRRLRPEEETADQSSAAIHSRLKRYDKVKRIFGAKRADSAASSSRSRGDGGCSGNEEAERETAEPEESGEDLAFIEALELQDRQREALLPTGLKALQTSSVGTTRREVAQAGAAPPALEAIQRQVGLLPTLCAFSLRTCPFAPSRSAVASRCTGESEPVPDLVAPQLEASDRVAKASRLTRAPRRGLLCGAPLGDEGSRFRAWKERQRDAPAEKASSDVAAASEDGRIPSLPGRKKGLTRHRTAQGA
ncbi:hypothetical protein cyc_05377 [Cyclospora cayetanensis]|uniref:Uncharacterized protein n=1 Tax=Cyclospora cayetanensis TaxID=88456 RepID=A0A1D3D3A0_9EIME|nr:hypothetical protein cyc_05377 [Cyclospora cayetanensis]